MKKFIDLTGQRFGRLKVIEKTEDIKFNSVVFICECDCGASVKIPAVSLLNGNSKSCGCQRKERALEKTTKHGLCYDKIYFAWDSMKQRCTNKKNTRYKDYGGRGIKVCNRWLKFENFRDDMYESYIKHVEEFGKNQTSIDRIDNDGDYNPENCRWATRKEQRLNQRAASHQKLFKAVSPEGIEYTSNNQSEFARKINVKLACLNNCLRFGNKSRSGWSFSYIGENSHGRR